MFRVCQKKLMFRVWRLHGFTQIYYISFGSFPIERSLAHFFPLNPEKTTWSKHDLVLHDCRKSVSVHAFSQGVIKKPCSHHLSIDTDVWETPASREKEKKNGVRRATRVWYVPFFPIVSHRISQHGVSVSFFSCVWFINEVTVRSDGRRKSVRSYIIMPIFVLDKFDIHESQAQK